MQSVLGVDIVGLPPLLWLPESEEPVDRFKSEIFNHRVLSDEDILDFGIFATTRAVRDADDKRPSFMPGLRTIENLNAAGYGISTYKLERSYGGLRRLQKDLGFHHEGYRPEKQELLERCEWMAQCVLPLVSELDMKSINVKDLFAWGSKRHLIPGYKLVRDILGGSTTEIRRIFGIEKPNARLQVTRRDLFRFGARVIDEHGEPLAALELNQRYSSEFLGLPYSAIEMHFGSLSAFWEHFGYFKNVPKMGADKMLDVGAQLAIKSGGFNFSRRDIGRLSAQKRFPGASTIKGEFGGGYPAYREAVRREYEQFLLIAEKLSVAGVCDEVIQIIGAHYSKSEAYAQSLNKNTAALAKISEDRYAARRVRNILQKGFDMVDDEYWQIQAEGFRASLTTLGIVSPDEVIYICGLIPRT